MTPTDPPARVDDTALQLWIANAAHPRWESDTFALVQVDRQEEIALRRELLALRQLARDLAAMERCEDGIRWCAICGAGSSIPGDARPLDHGTGCHVGRAVELTRAEAVHE